MGEEMQQEAVDVASAALEKYNIEKDIAAQIKKEFDKRHGPTWHVVVGKNFGSYVTHGASSAFNLCRGPRPRPSVARHRTWASLKSLVDAGAWWDRADECAIRNQALHLLLHRLARDPHLEVMINPTTVHWCVSVQVSE